MEIALHRKSFHEKGFENVRREICWKFGLEKSRETCSEISPFDHRIVHESAVAFEMEWSLYLDLHIIDNLYREFCTKETL